jgi:hypothetical protein
MACKLFGASSSSFVVTMKKGTRLWHLIPRPAQALKALLLMVPRVGRLIFRKYRSASETMTDSRIANEVSIKRHRVIQFNAFLKIEKTKLTIINPAPKPGSGVQISGQK